MSAPRFWRDPFLRDPGELQAIVRRTAIGVGMEFVAGEPPRRVRMIQVQYDGGHRTFDTVDA